MFLLLGWLAGCGSDGSDGGRGKSDPGTNPTDTDTDPTEPTGTDTDPTGTDPTGTDPTDTEPEVLPPVEVPRISPEQLKATIDAGSLDCAGGAATLSVEIAGRADHVDAVLVAGGTATPVPLAAAALPAGSLWQRYDGTAPFAGTCGRREAVSVVVARAADGAAVDCVVGGADAAKLVSGELAVPLGLSGVDLGACRIR